MNRRATDTASAEAARPALLLPTLFLLAAGHAMCDGACDSYAERLEMAAARVAPLLARRALLAHSSDIVSLANDAAAEDNKNDERVVEGRAKLRAALPADYAWILGDLISASVFNGVTEGIEVGIVAGYLLAQLVAGTDGAQ